MKRNSLVVLIMTLIFGTYSFAQNKMAHISIQDLLVQMPEMKSVRTELEKLQKTYSSDIENSLKELRSKATAYQNEANALSQEELEKRSDEFRKKGEELQTMEANIQQARSSASEELQKKQEEMISPVLKKVQDAIKSVAKSKGYTYVFDSSPGGSVLVADGKDISVEVRKELGF